MRLIILGKDMLRRQPNSIRFFGVLIGGAVAALLAGYALGSAGASKAWALAALLLILVIVIPLLIVFSPSWLTPRLERRR